MIPCPVCLKVLDGAGGTCAHHMEWTIGRVWLPGLWPSLGEITANAQTPDQVAERYTGARHGFYEAARGYLARARLPRYERGVLLGFRHYADRFEDERDGYAQFATGIVLPLLVRAQLLEHDQVEGICHLFYSGAPNESPGPGPGVELLIAEGPAR